MDPGQKKVLVLGAGYVAGPCVEYLTRDNDFEVTVGKMILFCTFNLQKEASLYT